MNKLLISWTLRHPHSLAMVPKCIAEVSYEHFGTSAEMSWVLSVLGPKCRYTIETTRPKV